MRTPEQRVIATAQRALRKGKSPAQVLSRMVFANNGRLSPEVLLRLLREVYKRHRPEEFPNFYANVREGADETQKAWVNVISSADLLARTEKDIPDLDASQRWGLHVRAGAVTQFVGETSAGKSVFLKNLAHNLAAGKEFLGLMPPYPLRVLHLDFESDDYILQEQLKGIGTVEGWDFQDPRDFQDVGRGPLLLYALERRVIEGRYDVVIVDPLMDAWPCDENDNNLANLQMYAFRDLARRTNAAVVLAHNSGLRTAMPKSRAGKMAVAKMKYFGRGATARVDRADVSINFVDLTEKGGEEERYLYVPKSRARNRGDSMLLKFAGEFGYELQVTPEVRLAMDRFATVESYIRDHGPVVSTGAIVAHLVNLGCGKRTAEDVVRLMKERGRLARHLVQGQWILPVAA